MDKGQEGRFHSLRHTLGTNLALAGTSPRVAMEAMRHIDIRLTTKTYTDTGLLPVSDAVAKVPSFLGSPEKDSQIDSQTLFREGQAFEGQAGRQPPFASPSICSMRCWATRLSVV